MDTQQAYEMMRTYLTRPGARRAAEDGPISSCLYETTIDNDTHRCAIGCLLSPVGLSEMVKTQDGGWVQLREYCGALGDAEFAGFTFRELDGVDRAFLYEAQQLHDSVSSWELGRFDVAKLDELALDYDLKVVVEPVRAPREEMTLVG